MKDKIYRLRFGFLSVESLSDVEVLEVMDYCVSNDVMGVCQNEINRRREVNLKKEKK